MLGFTLYEHPLKFLMIFAQGGPAFSFRPGLAIMQLILGGWPD